MLLVCTSSTAFAAPGDHIRLGDVELIPELTVAGDYHSNVYLSDVDPIAAPSVSLNPRLALRYERPDYTVASEIGYSTRTFIDTLPKDDSFVHNLDQYDNGDASLALELLKRSVVGVRLDDKFAITNTPAEFEGADHSANIRTVSNDLNGAVLVRPGSALEFGAVGQVGVDNYHVPIEFTESTSNREFNNRSNYGPQITGKWSFLPKTAIVAAVGVGWNKWSDNLIRAVGPEAEGLDYGDFIGKPDSFGWRVSGGLRGQITVKVSAELQIGYGRLNYDEETVFAQASELPASSQELDLVDTSAQAETFARDLKSFQEGSLLIAQVGWVPVKGHTFNLGYRKDFVDAFFTNYDTYSLVFLRYKGMFVRRVGVSGELMVRLDSYHGEVSRKDLNTRLKGQVSYKFTPYLSAAIGGGWNERACGDPNCQGGAFEPSEFDDVYGNLGVTFTY